MSDSAYEVETTSRLAQWRMDSFAFHSGSRKSLPFSMGNWNWHIVWVERSRTQYWIKLFPEISSNPPIASFSIRVVSSAQDRKIFTHPEVTDKRLENTNAFIWDFELPYFCEKLILEVEFLDLKTASPNGGEACSIWAGGASKERPHSAILSSFNRMLSESIHADITINASNGSIRAHRVVLAARSPVFRSMFSHDLKEKAESTIDIPDMPVETVQAMLDFMYGGTQHEEFHAHRLALLQAADKYDIEDLKEAVGESLVDDIYAKNVLERLRIASSYQLPNLKSGCLRYLVKFGKIFDILDDFNEFMQSDDRDLVAEVVREVLDAWKGF